MGERANERTGERANGRTNEQANERTSERANGRTGRSLVRAFGCSGRAIYWGARLTGKDWERLRMAENAWEARQREHKTTWQRDRENTRRRGCETTRRRDYETTRLRNCETTRLRDCGTTRLLKNTGILRHSQAFSVVRGCARQCAAVRYRAWLIREFREIKEFRDVRAMPATNQVSDVLPLNRAVRSLTSLNSLISLNSLLTARYHHALSLSQSFSAVLTFS